MARIEFKDGRWIELRPMYVADELAFHDMAAAGTEVEDAESRLDELSDSITDESSDDDKKAVLDKALDVFAQVQSVYFDKLRASVVRMEAACRRTSWGGPLSEGVTRDELFGLVRQWRMVTEDDAVPPVNEPS